MEELIPKLIEMLKSGKWLWLLGIVAVWLFVNRDSVMPFITKLKGYLPKLPTDKKTGGTIDIGVNIIPIDEERMKAVSAYYYLRDALKKCNQHKGVEALDQIAVCLSHIGETHAESI